MSQEFSERVLCENVVLRAAIEGWIENGRGEDASLAKWREKFKELLSRESVATTTVLEVMCDLYERGRSLESLGLPIRFGTEASFIVCACRRLVEVGAIPQ